MLKKTFIEKMKKLEAAFSKKLEPETIAVYWGMLEGEFTDQAFSDRCDEVIKKERWFPSIAVFFDCEDCEDQFDGAI